LFRFAESLGMNALLNRVKPLLNKRYPKSFIIRKPFLGALLFAGFVFVFIVLYQPLHFHGSRSFGFKLTMLLYCTAMTLPIFLLAALLNYTNCFSREKEWTFSKELISVFIILCGMGIGIYFAGFLIENPQQPRWNLPTFFNSLYSAMLVGAVPVLFFSLINLRYLFVEEFIQEYRTTTEPDNAKTNEKIIVIGSKLKKEDLSFYPSQFVYAESDGNYVVFHLETEGGSKEVMIRNSISDIESQLSSVPYIIRTHRAFIVNVRRVNSKMGNTLGYRLKLKGSSEVIPVSRQNILRFDEVIKINK
jgi:hypothetical protein